VSHDYSAGRLDHVTHTVAAKMRAAAVRVRVRVRVRMRVRVRVWVRVRVRVRVRSEPDAAAALYRTARPRAVAPRHICAPSSHNPRPPRHLHSHRNDQTRPAHLAPAMVVSGCSNTVPIVAFCISRQRPEPAWCRPQLLPSPHAPHAPFAPDQCKQGMLLPAPCCTKAIPLAHAHASVIELAASTA